MKLTNRIEENQYVVFKMNEEFYGIDIYNVKSIERIFTFTRVPNAPKYVKGVINLRGDVVPVIDLRKRLGFDTKEIDKDSRIIIVNYDESAVGLLVDSSSEVVKLNKEDIDNVPTVGDSLKQYFVDSIGKKDERLIMLLNLKKIFEVKGYKKNES